VLNQKLERPECHHEYFQDDLMDGFQTENRFHFVGDGAHYHHSNHADGEVTQLVAKHSQMAPLQLRHQLR
jgi:hypothetical protein